MRIVVGEVEEEGLLLFGTLFDDFDAALGIEFGEAGEGSFLKDHFVVIEEDGRVGEITGEAVVGIETLLAREEFGLGAEVPFPDHVGGVSFGLELLGQGDLVGVESEEPMGGAIGVDAHVEAGALWVSAGEKCGAGRGAD